MSPKYIPFNADKMEERVAMFTDQLTQEETRALVEWLDQKKKHEAGVHIWEWSYKTTPTDRKKALYRLKQLDSTNEWMDIVS